ncbi:MFS transporter [Roseibium sp. MMSF_3412]|uniref:MFS transporter n=1 Tax=Roseibium sp. MMSF_3412 TaxID=3046712 RepID=UPI00273F1837|nr:MFS transporter [Roseibium sp. MMSF_3412]
MTALSRPTARFHVDPRLVLFAGALIALVALGMRHSFGLFLGPVTGGLSAVDRETFGFAIALQNLMWGIAQPFAGMIADRFGSARVIFAGGLFYAGGLLCASAASTSLGLVLGLGVLVGIGLSATSYAVVLGAVGRRFPPERRTSALGVASLGGSLGIFLSVPVTLSLIDSLTWPLALVSLALVAATICVLAPVLNGRSVEPGADQSLRSALSEALSHRGFLLLVLGFFVCGFQLAFIGTHLPAYLLDRHLPGWLGGAALATIGATNIAGTFVCGLLGDRISKKKILVVLYLARAVAVAVFVMVPPSDISVLLFAAVMGFTWLGTVPLTTGIVAQIFGARYLATLVGIVFLMHQTGSFLGAWLGGLVFEQTGSYDIMWWSVVAFGLLAALVHLPINERPLAAKDRVFGNVLSNA